MSVVKNALYKVIRVSSAAELGEHVVVQGGTFYNNGVLRAFEQELGREVVRPSIAGLMGAFGAALFGRKKAGEIKTSSVLTQKALNTFGFKTKTTHCGLCTNHCLLTINTFSYGNRFISGNRCDRPVNQKKTDFSLDIYAYKTKLLRSYTSIPGPRAKIGIPMGLNFFETLPFWHTLFTHLGFEVVLSPPSSRKFYFKGQGTIPSDTVCYPAKLMHGHIYELSQMEGVDTIFYPCMSYNIDEGIGDQHFNCPVVAYYPEVIKASCKELDGKLFIYDYVGIHRPKDFVKRFTKILAQYFCGISERDVKKAADDAYRAYDDYLKKVRVKGEEIIQKARQQGMPVIVLAGRPYHADEEINHGINQLIAKNRVAIISEECVSHYLQKAPTSVLNQWTYHARLYSAARYVATQKDMHLVQLVSFGCGLDAVTTDEVRAILHRGGKLYAQIKIDEISNLGAVNIRLRSLFSTLEQQGEEQWTQKNIV